MTPAGYFLWNGVHWEQVSEAFADDPDVVALYPAPAEDAAMRYDAVEAVRKATAALPRYSFLLNSGGGVSRVEDRSGRWIEWDEAHKLFDPEMVDWLLAKAQAAAAVNALPGLLGEVERLRRDGFDSRHPAAQNLLGRNARLSIALDIVRDILADDCEPTPITAEHWAPIHDQAQSVVRERNELRQEVERLRADAARLDHIEKHARYDPKMDGNHAWWPTTFENVLRGPTLRAAIDAAMGEEKRE